MSEEMRGSVYLRVGDSGVLELRAKAVTILQFYDRYYTYLLDEPEEGYRVIREDFEGLPEVGVIVFEGTNLDAVGAALAKEWELSNVKLVEDPLQFLLEIPIPEGFTDEGLIRAIVDALHKAFPGYKGRIRVEHTL